MTAKPLVWAHRGASGYAPENTLESFRKAVELNADGVELDVHLTKDNELVVIHDEYINRTSDGTGAVKDMTLAELRRYNYNRTHPEYTHCDIPTMREVFELLKPTGLTIDIELKTGIFFYPGIEKAILDLTAEFGMEDRVCYSSFNHESLMRLKELKPDAEIGFLYADGIIDFPVYAHSHGADAINPALYNLLLANVFEQCRDLNLDINVWTVNEPEHIRLCIEHGVHSIISNYPDRVRDILHEYE